MQLQTFEELWTITVRGSCLHVWLLLVNEVLAYIAAHYLNRCTTSWW